MHLILCRSSINGFSCILNAFKFTVYNYISNLSPGQLQSSIYSVVENDIIISSCNVFCLLSVRSKAVVLLLLTFCLLLLPLWESVIVLCFVACYFMSILVVQSS